MTTMVSSPEATPRPDDSPWLPGHRDGLLDLGMRQDSTGRTCVRTLHQRFPLRTTVPFYLDPNDPSMAFVYAQNPTGGVFEGDRLLTRIDLESGARMHLTTQSATKLFAVTSDHAEQDYRFRVREGAVLEHIPDMLIPHANSSLQQRISVDLAPGAIYLGAEIVAPGRVARGELFEYGSLQLLTTLAHDGSEVATDVVRLVPTEFNPRDPGQMGNYDYLATMTIAARGQRLDPMAFDTAAAEAVGSHGVGAAGALPGDAGVSVRILTDCSQSAVAAVRRCWEHARNILLGQPLPRTPK